ncbi:ATP-binding protein [Granulosicoccus sp.]|nr:ATP-binding protein [Granulosicoccus sp.]MDB4223955.1 ATP-binding protein [Granulosicoccus sp.]
MSKKRVPATGEINAIQGYFVQYEFSAITLLRLMQDNRLDAISVCDRAAGILDDLVAFSGSDLLAYQVKSQTFPKPFRLRTELIGNGLIEDIANSWAALRKEYPDQKIHIYYVLPGYPSTSDKKNFNGVGHSANLFSYLADPDTEMSRDALLCSEWAPFIREVITASTLQEDQFFEMFCQIKFFDQGEILRRQIETLEPYAAKKAQQIKHLLPEIVANRITKKVWSEQNIIETLGWDRISGLRASHSFPLYRDVQANPAVEESLRKTIYEHSSGYISLIGPPGMGKSTTLQRAVPISPDYGVARYLAFLPDERHGLGRAEATDFLNDITIALGRLGFSRARFSDESQLREQFLKQLEEAHDLFREKGQKTVIVVDGLDHIQREESPHHNFLAILPPPQSIPEGVLFLLGSQYLKLDGLAPSIAQQASAGGRCTEMRPLPKPAIFDMAEKAELPEHVDRQALFDVCEGHPLIARYYIEKLSESKSKEEADSLLSCRELGTSIDQMYELVWAALDPNEGAKHVLALLARADNNITPRELASIVNDAAVESVHQQAGFLLSGRKDGKWSIFHNSFRVFLVRQTRMRFGQDDPDLDKEFHTELAVNSANTDTNSNQRWLELRYRSRADDKQAVKYLANPELFRKYLEEFRSGKDVYVDLRLAYGAIEDLSDLPKFVQLMMAEKEIDYRLEAISQLDLVQTHIVFEEQDRAFEIALANAEPTDGVFELLDYLYIRGNVERARALFEAIEPAEYFFGQDHQKIHPVEIRQFYDWIKHAHRFRTVENILEIVQGLSFGDLSQYDPIDNLKFVLARSILQDEPTRDVDTLCTEFGLNEQAKTALLVQAANDLHASGDGNQVQSLLTRLQEQIGELSIPNCRVCSRLAFEQGDHDLAKIFLANVRVLASDHFSDHSFRENVEDLFASTFAVARLSEHLDKEVLFEHSEKDEFQNHILKNVIRLGRLQGKLEKADNPSDVPAKLEIKNTCLFLALSDSRHKPHSFEPLSSGSLAWFAKTLVRIATLHGDSTLQALEEQIEQLYKRGNNRISSYSPFRLTFAKEVYRADGDQAKATRRLRCLENFIETEYTPHSAVEMRLDLANGLAEIDAVEQGKRELSLIHSDTCGYWLAAKKEPQYIFWNEALERACRTAPDRTGEFTAELAQFVIGLSDTEGSDTGHRITYGLLENAVWNPQQCAGIISRLIGTSLVSWADMVAATLHGIVLVRPDLAHMCFIFYCRLVIPFNGSKSYNAIGPIYSRLPDALRKEAENDFIKCAQMFADTSNEAALLSHLKKVCSSENNALDQSKIRADRELKDIRKEGLEDGSSSSYTESEKKLEQIQTLHALTAASDGVEDYGIKQVDYLYARRASELLQTASMAELLTFLDSRPIVLEDTKFIISATSRLMELGGTQKADELYEIAEKRARSGSWSAWLGGEKIAFQKLCKKRKGEASQSEGFASIVDDFAHGRASAKMVLPDLADVFDLVAPDAAWDEVWRCAQDHISTYREYIATEPVEAITAVSSQEELIGHILQIGFSLQCYVLTDRLRESLRIIAVQVDGLIVFEAITNFLLLDERNHREISQILWKLLDEPNCKDLLISYAEELSNSDDAVVTYVARNILHRFKIHFDVPTEKLPAFYKLVVSGNENAEKFELPAGVEPGSDFWIDDPWYWTAVLEHEIKMISRASGIEIEAIRRRCAEFMRDAGSENAFGPPAENALKINLNSLGLRFTYARLMPNFAIKAIGRVIEELTRAKHIDLRVLQVIWSKLGGAHSANYQIPVKPRPNWIIPATLPKIDNWKIDAEAWLRLGTENTFVPVIEGWFVLAEQLEFGFLDTWKKYSVIRTSLPDSEWSSKPDENLFGMPMIMDLENIDRTLYEHNEALLCTINDSMYGDLRKSTLTFNNNVLNEYGWKRSQTRPLDIYSDEGELVAKTFMWIDGIGYPESRSMERFGHGHVVLISDVCKANLERLSRKLVMETRVIQRHESSDGIYDRVYFNGVSEPE